MSAHTLPRAPRILALAAMLAGAALTTGCAQMRSAGYYNPPPESTITDAQYQGTGAGYRTVVHAPSQLQIDLKRDDATRRPTAQGQQQAAATEPDTPAPPPPAGGANARMVADSTAAAPAAEAEAGSSVKPSAYAFMPQAQTYLGTFPCFSPSMECQAQRVTLTLAPNGRWRSRTTYLDTSAKPAQPVVEQGCWDATTEKPARVLLLDASGNARAELVASANNVLRVRSVLGHTPTLDYSLTRQPDLDPIDELGKQAAPKCE